MIGLLAVVVLGSVFVALPALTAAPTERALDWTKEVNPSKCNASGQPIINVTQKVKNSVDSGTAGNYWAFSNYNRHIQVWKQDLGKYCALVSYVGQFNAQNGQVSPGSDGVTLSGDELGTFTGGYRGIINGELKDAPAWKTHGSVGSFDYKCDLTGSCPGAVNWVDQYFTKPTFTYDWWGWIYHGRSYGTWINSVDGNQGDIH